MRIEQSSNTARWVAGTKSVLMLVVAIFVLAACKDGSNASQVSFVPSEAVSGAPAAATTTTASNGAPAQNSYANIVERVAPAVVTVRAASRARAPQQHPFLDDPAFREFFGDRLPQQPQQPRRQSSLGSGIIVTADGYILTNHHVVDGAERITIELTDRRTFEAKVIGSDQPSDLAVLKIESSGLPFVPLGNSDQVRVGDVALAIGNPLGVGQTVTSGIVSAKSRSTPGVSDGSFEDFLQTDAAINSGNSGGALINTNGELIGINSQILSPSGGNIGIGFAIPTSMARTVMEQLIKTGKVRRGQLGVLVQNIDADLAASLELKNVRGVIVNSISPGSAAERAGLRRGDVLMEFNGNAIADSNALRNNVAATAPNTEVTLTIQREGREQQVRATLGEFNPETARAERNAQDPGNANAGSSNYGMTVRPLAPEQAAQLGLEEGAQGLLVTAVDPSGAAADAGVQPRDVIEQVNRQPVRTVEQLKSAIQRSGSRPALLLVNRRGQSTFLSLRVQS